MEPVATTRTAYSVPGESPVREKDFVPVAAIVAVAAGAAPNAPPAAARKTWSETEELPSPSSARSTSTVAAVRPVASAETPPMAGGRSPPAMNGSKRTASVHSS